MYILVQTYTFSYAYAYTYKPIHNGRISQEAKLVARKCTVKNSLPFCSASWDSVKARPSESSKNSKRVARSSDVEVPDAESSEDGRKAEDPPGHEKRMQKSCS